MRKAVITKIGVIWETSSYSQYPTPIYDEEKKTLRIYYTDRYKNMSIPCFIDFTWPDLSVALMRYKVLELGKEGEADSHGISIQYADKDWLWYTGYKVTNLYPFQTIIGDAKIDNNNKIQKFGFCKRLTQADPISVCTPSFGILNGKRIFFYNSHTRWDLHSSPPEAMYGVKGIEVKSRFDLQNINTIYQNFYKNYSVTRPWPFKFQGEDFLFSSMRENYGHREHSLLAYKPLLYSFKHKKYIQVIFKNADDDFMRGYMVATVIDNKCWVFYNNAYNSGIQMGVLDFVGED